MAWRPKTGTAGNDFLYGGGPDTLVGLAGDDSYAVYGSSDVVVENSGEGNDTVLTFASYALAAGASIETLSTAINAGSDPIALTGNNLSQIIVGNYVSNTLDGGGGDALVGLRGDDVYRVYGRSDLVLERAGEGTDRVITSGDFVLSAGSSVEHVETADPTSAASIFLGGNELVQTIVGGAGNDLINGGGGNDQLVGGAGDDTYRVFGNGTRSAEAIVELSGGGNDAVYASGTYTLGQGASVEYLSTAVQAGADPINLTGNNAGQVIVGNYGNNILVGNPDFQADQFTGPDTLIGLLGNDTYRVFDGLDVIVENPGEGDDTVFVTTSYALRAGVSVETLSTVNNSASTAAEIFGNEINNRIIGNFGSNVLDGGGGNDTLQGLDGADFFRFSTPLGSGNIDTIVDFGLGADTIQLDRTVFGNLALGTLPVSAIAYGAAAADADDRIVYNPQNGALSYDSDGNGANAAVQFASLPSGLGAATIQVAVVAPADPGVVRVSASGTFLIGGATGSGIALATEYPQATSIIFGREESGSSAYDLVFGPNSAAVAGRPQLSFSGGFTIGTFDFSQLGTGLVYDPAAGYVTAGGAVLLAATPTSSAGLRLYPATIQGTPFNDVIDRTDGVNYGDQPFGTVNGGAGDDVLTGGRALFGDDGDDRLAGVAFTQLTGGTGRDTFVLPIFSPTVGANTTGTLPNSVTDLNPAEDRIELTLNIASDLPVGALDPSRFAIGSAATTPDQRILYDPSSGVLRYDANGSLPDAAGARAIFGVLPTGLDLAAVQFEVILP